MATIMTAMTSDLYSHGRSDPEYYLPNHTAVEADLLAVTTTPLRKLGRFSCSAFYPAATHLYNEDGKPFLRCVDIVDYPIISADQPFARIPREFADAYSTIRHLNSGDIVISKVGSPCFASLLSEDIENAAMTRTVLGMSNINTSLVDPHYLVAFLRSKYGFDQLMRERELTIQYQLTLERTRKVKVFLPTMDIQKQIGDTVRAYYHCLKESKATYSQAQQLLESELGLDKLHFDKPVGYTARFSEMELSRRFDSEHYYPAFDNLKRKLPARVQLVPLGPLLTYCQRGKQPIYSENGLPVLNSKHILNNKITLEGNRFANPNPVPSLQIQFGDVLINGTGRGTIGRTAPYLVNEHQAIPDNHVTILRSQTLDPAYLSFYLNSQAGQLQVEKHQRGSSGQLELYPFDIRRFQVWEAPQSIQQEIRRLYEHATESAKQSKALLNQAKSRVEQLVDEAVQS